MLYIIYPKSTISEFVTHLNKQILLVDIFCLGQCVGSCVDQSIGQCVVQFGFSFSLLYSPLAENGVEGWCPGLPWEVSANYIRSGHRIPDDFEPGSLRTIVVSEAEGIKAIVGKPKGGKDGATEVVSFLFDVSKGWTLEKAKEWFERHQKPSGKEHFFAVLPFKVLEKIVDKPLRIRGIALTAGMSRNMNIYLPE